MRISDWSSDVCSSDLEIIEELCGGRAVDGAMVKGQRQAHPLDFHQFAARPEFQPPLNAADPQNGHPWRIEERREGMHPRQPRTEERRGGQEWDRYGENEGGDVL